MAASYSDLVSLVRDWSNRDSEVLPDSVVQAGLRYAADEAYRLLEIPPLEKTIYYILTSDGTTLMYSDGTSTVVPPNIFSGIVESGESNRRLNSAALSIPSDLVSFIHIRSVGSVERDTMGRVLVERHLGECVPSTDVTVNTGIVFNEKTDVRTYHDFFGEKKSYNFWTRQGSNILLSGDLEADQILEMYYYGRLPALDARIEVAADTALDADGIEVITAAAYNSLTYLERRTYIQSTVDDTMYIRSATEASNWLKDQNERVVLFGALHHIFNYLQETEQSQIYKMKFMESIQELNMEENNRRASGGNIQINYNGLGQI